MEIHLAGHMPDPTLGTALLVDSHDALVAPEVFRLYERLVARIGPRPTLIERDGNIPVFIVLLAERNRTEARLRASSAGAGSVNDGLADFRTQFVQALFSAEADAAREIAKLVAQPGFAVYRNTVIKGRIDALQANYPAVARLIGEEWFRAAAAIFGERSTIGKGPWLQTTSDFAVE